MTHMEYMIQKIMMRFDLNDKNVKEMCNKFSEIGQIVDAYAMSIKKIE